MVKYVTGQNVVHKFMFYILAVSWASAEKMQGGGGGGAMLS